jgi:hypothetical protein
VVLAEALLEGGGQVRQMRIKRVAKRESVRTEALPLDPRDADVVRAKRRLYERSRARRTS